MSLPLVRPARSTDAGAVGDILSQFVDANPWLPRVHSRAQEVGFAGDMIDRDWVQVAEHDGRVLGFSACAGPDLHALYVAARARRNGIGTTLLNHLKRSRDRIVLWTFQANAGAQAFYAAHGFAAIKCTDGADNDEGLPDIHFEWVKERQ